MARRTEVIQTKHLSINDDGGDDVVLLSSLRWLLLLVDDLFPAADGGNA
jgi:hypothetical protein